MSDFFRRLQYLLNHRRLDRELANDLEFHREMAAREGRENLGNTLHLREEARDAWGGPGSSASPRTSPTPPACYANRPASRSPPS